MEEIQNTALNMKNNKVPGQDGIPNDFFFFFFFFFFFLKAFFNESKFIYPIIKMLLQMFTTLSDGVKCSISLFKNNENL